MVLDGPLMPQGSGPGAGGAAAYPFRLLVADDNEDNRLVLSARLKRLGYGQVILAENGRQALDLIREQPFDLVLLDILMPELDGFQVLEQLRAEGRLADLPVIVVSALSEMDHVVRCVELGAEDYLHKPFNPTLLKARVGACLEKKRLRDQARAYLDRLERELRSARDIQLAMVPTAFPAPTAGVPVEVFATLEPAREVGGDLYDVFTRPDGSLCVVVADVSDKGAPAALFMARTKSLLRLAATLPDGGTGALPDPAAIVTRANTELCRDNGQGMFVTLFLAVLDPASGALAYCNAGHPVPYVVSAAQAVEPLDGARDRAVGIRATFRYRAGAATLALGDCLFLFTDGVTEAMDPSGALFEEERLVKSLAAQAGQPARTVVEAVIAAVREFAGPAPQADDIAALALRRVG